MHTALEMKGISTKTICTACYHLTIVVFCTHKSNLSQYFLFQCFYSFFYNTVP